MLQRCGLAVLFSMSCLTLSGGMCFAQTATPAQNPAGTTTTAATAETPYTIGVTVRRVVLDVVVTDSDHHPVRGLTKSDFTIDGKQQGPAAAEL